MKDKEKVKILMRVNKIIGEDAVIVTIPIWDPHQKILISAELFPSIRSYENFEDVWYTADANLKAHSVSDLDIQNIQPAPSPIPDTEEFGL